MQDAGNLASGSHPVGAVARTCSTHSEVSFSSDRRTCTDSVAAVALALTAGIGKKTIGRLLEAFETYDGILEAAPDKLRTVHGIGAKTAAAIHRLDTEHLARLNAELSRAADNGIGTVTWRQYKAGYPGPLDELD